MKCAVNKYNISLSIRNTIEDSLLKSGFIKDGNAFKGYSLDTESFIKSYNKLYGYNVLSYSNNEITINVPQELEVQYALITDEGKSSNLLLKDFPNLEQSSWNNNELSTMLTYPELSEFTTDKLLEFIKSVNPNMKVEENPYLTEEGIIDLKKFLISVKNLSRPIALAEETSHLIVEMLPDESEPKKLLLKNITSFPIYSLTFQKYKDVYTKDGKPDFDKIKREASAKLISEYIYYLSTKDSSRIDTLGKEKQSLLRRIINSIYKFFGLSFLDKAKVYKDIASNILTGKNDYELKTEKDVDDLSYTNSYFYRLSEEQLFDNAIDIFDKKPANLLEIINKFSKEFGRKFNNILNKEEFEKLNEELKKDGNTVGKINKLLEISNLFSDAGYDFRKVTNANSFLMGIKQFLEGVDRLEILADSIYNVIKNSESAKTFDEAIKNIKELESYISIYETFNNIISTELASELVNSGVGKEVVESILNTKSKFDTINQYILNKERKDLFIFYKQLLSDTSTNIDAILSKDIEEESKKANPNPEILKKLNSSKEALIQTDQKILDILSGRGKDVDIFSTLSHLFSAAYTNGDQYVAGAAKYIRDNITVAHQKAKPEVLSLYEKIAALEKIINKPSYKIGQEISYVEKVFSKSDTNNSRSVRVFLNPHKNIRFDRDVKKEKVNTLIRELYKANSDNDDTKKSEILEQLKEARKEYNDFLNKYYHRPFIREYYNFRSTFDENPIFLEAMEEFHELTQQIREEEEILKSDPSNKEAYDKIAFITRERANLLNENDIFGQPKNDEKLNKVRILKSFFKESEKYKEIDLVQTERSFLIAKNRYKQRVDFAIQEVKNKNITSVDQIEKELQTLLGEKRLKFSYEYKEENNDPTKVDYDLINDIIIDRWYDNNIVIKRTELYFKDVELLNKELDKLKEGEELSDEDKELIEARDLLYNIKYGSKDQRNEVNPRSFTEDEIDDILYIEDKIEELKESRPKKSFYPEDLTDEDLKTYDSYNEIIEDPSTPASKKRYYKIQLSKLISKYKNSPKAKAIRQLYEELASLNERKPTEYYWEEMDNFIPHLSNYVKDSMKGDDFDDIVKEFYNSFIENVNSKNYDELDFTVFTSALWQDFLMSYLKDKNPDLKNWFTTYHSSKKVYDSFNRKFVTLPYVRSSIYITSIPVLPEHKEEMYANKYIRKRVKDEYRTGYDPQTKKVDLKRGIHISNRELDSGFHEFLPLTKEYGEPSDTPYRNEEYYKLVNSSDPVDKAKLEYLNLLIESNLKSQESVPSNMRSWLDVPVMSLSNVEEKVKIPETLKSNIDKIKSIFTKNEQGDALAQEEGEDTKEDIDQLTQTIIRDKIPKLGMYNRIDIDNVSTDLLKSTALMIIRANEFEARSNASPAIKAIIRVLNDTNFVNNKSNKERVKIIEKVYSQHILEEVPDNALNTRAMRRISKLITTNTSLRMMADPIGGFINYGGAMINNTIEASAGKYLGPNDLIKGKLLATEAMKDMIADFMKKEDLSFNTLMFLTFDFVQGDFEEDLLDRSSAVDKLSSIRQLLMIPRKSGELYAQSAVALGILNKAQALNKNGEKFPVLSIYKKENGKLVLKDGFSEEDWNPINGTNFLKLKQKIHRVNYELHGNYAKIDQTEISRYSIGKLAENMKRWFVPALLRRMGRETADITFEDINEGYYFTSAKAAKNIFTSLFTLDFGGAKSWWDYYRRTPREKENLRRTASDFAQSLLLFLIFTLLLGYEGDDKNKKLKKNTWFQNTAILLALRMYSENTAYIPVPPFGYQEMKRNITAPFTLPIDAISNFAAMGQLGLYQIAYWLGAKSFENDLYYSKDSGFMYSEKGDSKLMKYIIKSLGYSGYTLEPDQYIITFDNLQRRLK